MDAKEALEKVLEYVIQQQEVAPSWDDSRVYLINVEVFIERMLKENYGR